VQDCPLPQGKLLALEEYYKKHPHNGGQGKYSKVDHESVNFFWHKNENTCSPQPNSIIG
jgi:hypothetical protein